MRSIAPIPQEFQPNFYDDGVLLSTQEYQTLIERLEDLEFNHGLLQTLIAVFITQAQSGLDPATMQLWFDYAQGVQIPGGGAP